MTAMDTCFALQHTLAFQYGGTFALLVLLVLMVVVPMSLASCLLTLTLWWTLFYIVLTAAIEQHVEGQSIKHPVGSAYTLASYVVSIFHQSVVCGSIFTILLVQHGITDPNSTHAGNLTDWWFMDWDWSSHDYSEQIFAIMFTASLVGYELKDFFRPGLEGVMLFHHMAVNSLMRTPVISYSFEISSSSSLMDFVVLS